MSTLPVNGLEIDREINERLGRLAEARHQTPGAVMREAIEQYVEREEMREEFRLHTLASLDHYRNTGLHVTEEEADAWLTKLEDGEDAPPPQCHV